MWARVDSALNLAVERLTMVGGEVLSAQTDGSRALRNGERAARVAGAFKRQRMVRRMDSLMARGRMPQKAVMLMKSSSPAVALSALGTLMENAAALLVRTEPNLQCS